MVAGMGLPSDLITEAMGRTLATEPVIPSVLAGRALALAGSAAQRATGSHR